MSKIKETLIALAFIGVIIAAVLGVSYSRAETMKSQSEMNIVAFEKGESLICGGSSAYVVSKESGWVIYKDYFKSEDRVVGVGSCKLDEE